MAVKSAAPDLMEGSLAKEPMPHIFTAEQEHVKSETRRLLRETYAPEALRALLDQAGHYDRAFWRNCCDMGWPAIAVGEDYGGLGMGVLELGLVAEACGGVCCGAPFLTTSLAVVEALRLGGDEETRSALLPQLARGDKRGAFAFAEGGDILPSSPAVRFENGKLYGCKPCVVGGQVAESVVVLAYDPTRQGTCLALVDANGASVRRELVDTFDNSRCTAHLHFDAAPAQRLAGDDGKETAAAILRLLAIVVAFEQLGGAEAALERATAYAVARRVFGQPIGAFQAIKHRLAEMYVANQLARGNAMRAALTWESGGPDQSLHAAAARLSATQAYEFAAREAIQIHGAIGVTWESDLHLGFRRSRSLALECGPMSYWENGIVEALRREAA